MIIKVQTPGENNWRFYDNARAVQTAAIPIQDVPKFEGQGPLNSDGNFGFTNGDVWEEILMHPNIPSSSNVLLVSFVTGGMSTGEPINIYTNAQTYLLNDQGKTIERLY